MPVEVRIVNASRNNLPGYATEGAAGMDLRADLHEAATLQPLERLLLPTGLSIEMPPGFEAQVRPRSGLAIRQGLTVINAPGTIDSDYRGEIKVPLINLSGEAQVIHPGDRIAQLVVQQVERVEWQEVSVLNASARNIGGFGSTGKN